MHVVVIVAVGPAGRYVESFDQATMAEMARIVSLEGAALVERQASALLGDIKKLTAQVGDCECVCKE